jgi:hypothetical protein
MTKFQRTSVAVACCIVAFFLLLGWIGDYDYCEQVVLRMTQEQYDSVKDKLTEQNGTVPSEREIAHWWIENHK